VVDELMHTAMTETAVAEDVAKLLDLFLHGARQL
jgi:hypothetical protein